DLPVVACPAQVEGEGEPVLRDGLGRSLAGQTDQAVAPDGDAGGGVAVLLGPGADRDGAADEGEAGRGGAVLVQAVDRGGALAEGAVEASLKGAGRVRGRD